MEVSQNIDSANWTDKRMDVRQLIHLACSGLVPMYDAAKQLFYHRISYGSNGAVPEGWSPRYTAMTLLGLHRFELAGFSSPIDIQATLRRLLTLEWIDNIGDAGLLLWLVAVVAPELLDKTCSSPQVASSLAQYAAGSEAPTMELAWLLTGLSYARMASSSSRFDGTDMSMKCYRSLTANQGSSGFFGHQAVWKSLKGMLRGRVGSFADQVYPVYALTQFARAHGVPAALQAATKCAQRICDVQGALGQWWWHYDAPSGRVFEEYPVYSVHQHGMGPMALFALGEEAGLDFSAPIFKGLEWIYGNNERGADMRDQWSQVVWRNIHRRSRRPRIGQSRNVAKPGSKLHPVGDFQILHECRPYELGWLLYAFAGRHTASSMSHPVMASGGAGQ